MTKAPQPLPSADRVTYFEGGRRGTILSDGMGDCVFCRIAAGTETASFVYRDDVVAGFLDIHPRNPGHTLIIPIAHHRSLAEVPETTGALMFGVAQRVAAALYASSLRCEGISLGLADGAAAGQEVAHCHLHVRPRFRGDHRRGSSRPARAELDAIASELRGALARGRLAL